MAAEENLDIDLPAAALRADGAELGISIETLATALEQALPGIASVERRKVGGFRSKRREVRRIAVPLGDEQFELLREGGGIRCTRHKVVRGITLSRDELAMADWIAELVGGVARRAEVSDRDRVALEGLLR
ncbi:MAG TPA: hypothetical protein VFC30_04075 [Solirubrobacteraceae bacterium]|nr:hypothetical protein [Solirubrobacteraceae bacterium]